MPASSYRKLPKPEGYTFQNRFVGKHLIYGTGSGWGYPKSAEQLNLEYRMSSCGVASIDVAARCRSDRADGL